MSKRCFKVTLSGYGGHVSIGSVSQEFYDYWKSDEDTVQELVDHIQGNDEDVNSPPMRHTGNIPISECNDIASVSGVYFDNGFWVTEIDSSLDDNEGVFHDFSLRVDSREVYLDSEIGSIPAIIWHHAQKGNFGVIFVETDGEDFNPDLLGVSVLETDMGDIVESIWYNKKKCEVDTDHINVWDNGLYSQVGYIVGEQK